MRTIRSIDSKIPRAASSVAEVADRYGIGLATVWRAIRRGRIAAFKIGQRTVIPLEAEMIWRASWPRLGPHVDEDAA